jgi:hypothetical protein
MSPSEKTHKFRRSPELKKLFFKMEVDGLSPFCEPKKLIGLHGTSRSKAEKIINEGMSPTPLNSNFLGTKDLLGEGLYFWEESSKSGGLPAHSAAFTWAKHRYPKAEPAAIVGTMTFQRLFDLVNPKNAHFALKFKERLKADREAHKAIEGSDKMIYWEEARFTKLLILACPKLADFDIDGVRWNGLGLPEYYGITQTGVCVKDTNCIKQVCLFNANEI